MAKRKANTKKVEETEAAIDAAPVSNETAVVAAEGADTSAEAEARQSGKATAAVAAKIGQLGDYKPIPMFNSPCSGC